MSRAGGGVLAVVALVVGGLVVLGFTLARDYGASSDGGSSMYSVLATPRAKADVIPMKVGEEVREALRHDPVFGGLRYRDARLVARADGDPYWLVPGRDLFCLLTAADSSWNGIARNTRGGAEPEKFFMGTPTSRSEMTVVGVVPDGVVSAANGSSVAMVARNAYVLKGVSGTVRLLWEDGSTTELDVGGLVSPPSEPIPQGHSKVQQP